MLVDSHCHLASQRFSDGETAGLLARAAAENVRRIVTLATSLDDIAANLRAAENSRVNACLGIHPCEVHHAPDDAVEKIAALVADPRVCGIGETGLDYFHPAPDGWAETDFRHRQQQFLRQHFELAAAARLPVVIHTRDCEATASFDDALRIFRDFHSSVRAVFHCYIGGIADAERVIALGGILSIGGIATFKNARAVHETVRWLPAGSFMLETDAPYLAPEPFRGKRNEPAYLVRTAEAIAKLRDETPDVLAAQTTRLAMDFFRFREDENTLIDE